MNEIDGEFWTLSGDYDAIVCPTTGILREDGQLFMRGRFTEGFASKFPKLASQFGRLVDHYGNSTYALLSYEPVIISFPTKDDFKDGNNQELIKRSALALQTITNVNKFQKVLVPQIENCYMGLKWAAIKSIIEPFLDKRFDIVNRMV